MCAAGSARFSVGLDPWDMWHWFDSLRWTPASNSLLCSQRLHTVSLTQSHSVQPHLLALTHACMKVRNRVCAFCPVSMASWDNHAVSKASWDVYPVSMAAWDIYPVSMACWDIDLVSMASWEMWHKLG